MATFASRLSRRSWIVLAVAGILVTVYSIAGFFVAPGIIKGQIERQLGATLHRRSTVGTVRVNPFALSVTIDTLRVADRDGVELFGWDELYVNAEILSIVRRELDLLEVRLVGPYGRLVVRRDGTLNISDIADSMNAASKAAPPSGPPPVLSIDELHIAGARFDVVDSSTRRPFRSTIGPWKIDLSAFATRRDANSRYAFSGRTESGESFAWAGDLAIDPVRSKGTFSLDSLRLFKYGPFYERTVGFDVPRGIMGVKAGYEVNLTPNARIMRLTGGEVTVGDLALVERGRGDTAVVLPALGVSGIEVDAVARRATIGAITLRRGTVNVARSRDSTINLLRMIATPVDSEPPAPAPIAKAPAAAAPPAPAWRWLIGRVAADSIAMRMTDSAAGRPARIALDGISASLDSVASDSSTVSQIHATASWAPRGTLTANGTVRIWHRDGQLAISAKDLSLRPFDAYLAPAVNMLITDGRLSSDATVRFAVADTLHPDFGFKGNVRVDRFATVDGLHRDPFISFRSLSLAGIDYASRGPKLSMKEIVLDAPVAELTVAVDGTPVSAIIFPKPAVDSVAGDSASKDSARVAPPPPKSAAKGAPAATAAPAMKVSIGRVKVTNGAIRLSDKSLEPAVGFAITKIDALTGRLSSDSLGTGTLELTAAIDDVAPVKVTGRFNPLSAKEGSELAVSIQGWELIPVGPYSGKYLGYLIAKGKMKVEMQYRVVGRELRAENKLTIDQFTFGDATNSPDATKMPVKLGIAVMRDRDGQIVFDVPVEGNLDDPNFRLGRVIGRAIMNVLTKLITSPFKLLGGLFGGGDADLSFAEFAPGAATLAPADTKKLDVLAKSLYERPALKLSIAGAVDTLADPAALRSAKLDARLRTLKWTALKAKDPNTPPPDSLALSPTDRPLWLAQAFAAAFPQDSAVLAGKKAKSSLPPYPPAEMERRLMPTIVISADDLRLLAAARAKACLDYLLGASGPKIEPERVFLTEGAVKPDGAKAIFTLE